MIVMEKEVKENIEKLRRLLSRERSVKLAYLFGSYARGDARRGSDIDVAVISDHFNGNKDYDRLLLWKLRRSVDARIEPQGLTTQRFNNAVDPVAHEIRTTGIRIA